MPSPMSWQLLFPGCCPVAGEPSEHWIVIWPAEYSLNGMSARTFVLGWIRQQTIHLTPPMSVRPLHSSPAAVACTFATTIHPLTAILEIDNGKANPRMIPRCCSSDAARGATDAINTAEVHLEPSRLLHHYQWTHRSPNTMITQWTAREHAADGVESECPEHEVKHLKCGQKNDCLYYSTEDTVMMMFTIEEWKVKMLLTMLRSSSIIDGHKSSSNHSLQRAEAE
jgi:hypothetical protein